MTIYVSQSGSDGNDGVAGKPVRTLNKALELARRARAEEKREIYLEEGMYENTSVALDERDSGLTIHSGGKATLCGGVKITGWTKQGDGSYSAKIPDCIKPGIRLITVGGRLCERARFPREGRLTHKSVFNSVWKSTSEGGWAVKPTEEQLTTVEYDPADIGADFDWENAELTIFHKWDESMAGIASHDVEKHVFKLAAPLTHPPGAYGSNTYIIWNTAAGMERGKWRADKRERMIYYMPFEGEDMQRAEVYAPVHDTIIGISGELRGLTLNGLNFTMTSTPATACGFGATNMPGAIESSSALKDCIFKNLTFSGLSGWGIKLVDTNKEVKFTERLRDTEKTVRPDGNRNVIIENCAVSDVGAGGLQLWSSGGGVVKNNKVERAGRIYFSAIGIYTFGCEVAGNELRELPYTGIASIGGESINIHGNKIYDVMRELNDGAGIYATFSKNGRLTGNAVFGIATQNNDDPGSIRNGLYLDEQTGGWIVEGNLTSGCASAMLNHMSKGNIIRNNAFVSQDGGVMLTFVRCEAYTVEDNAIQASGKVVIVQRRDAFSAFNNVMYSGAGVIESEYIGDDYKRSPRVKFNPFPD